MTTMEKVDPVLRWFRRRMREKLAEPGNLRKSHWSKCGHRYLMDCLRDEVDELMYAGDTEAIISECADIANFAMMIADNAHKQSTEQKGK